MRSSIFNAQLTTLRYRSTDWLAGLNLNIPVNMRECFKLPDFWPTLYISWRMRHACWMANGDSPYFLFPMLLVPYINNEGNPWLIRFYIWNTFGLGLLFVKQKWKSVLQWSTHIFQTRSLWLTAFPLPLGLFITDSNPVSKLITLKIWHCIE
jgi:hypothetical protein